MGANISASDCNEDEGPSSRLRLGDIPESCVALVLMNLDPPEICKMSHLNRAFRAASAADFIWESKLPSNYLFIAQKLLQDSTLVHLDKKQLFARLSTPTPFDGGTKEVWLDKITGGVCLAVSSKALLITGIDDRRYWSHISIDESRFATVAYLKQIWWFEVDGELDFQFPLGAYSLFFRLQLGKPWNRRGRRGCDTEHVHGWDVKPARFRLTTSDGQSAQAESHLDSPGKWVLYHVGDFVAEKPHELMKIKFSLTQIDCTHTKGGLCVDSVLVRPVCSANEVGASP